MREKEKSTQIIYVRHGVTDFPLDRIYCDDREDPALNELGVAQAQQAALRLKETQIDLIVASPYLRTRMTAEAIAQATGAPLEFNKALRERGFGIWDGLYFNEIETGYPEDFLRWKQNPADFKPENGESVHDLLRRVSSVISDITTHHKGKCVAVVAHVGPIRACLCDALNIPIKHYRQLCVDYASSSRVDYGKSQNNFIYMNQTHAVADNHP
ncbi:MAG: histidine phosphatase family protein [Gammaproteobacteria bacterium]|nr:histidine phosphatase family protein [Gammaproteobacteria bacterium]